MLLETFSTTPVCRSLSYIRISLIISSKFKQSGTNIKN
ncbi:hypothetical protein XENTR_v10007980 [Xenopus tropicalis]|nr:hypothetical protein XENTR_v10007980 [Xenopus tropicalis]